MRSSLFVLFLAGAAGCGTGAAQTSTTTTLSSNPNPTFTSSPNNAATFTATVTGGSGPTGTVTFADGGANLACGQGQPIPLSSGTAVCTTVFTTEGLHAITATYNPTGTFAASSGSLEQWVKNHSKIVSGAYCNTGAISAPGLANTSPYPSVINVGTDTTALTNSLATLTLTLNGLSTTATGGLSATHMLLVSPGGSHALDFLSFAGGGYAIPSAINLTMSDSASNGYVPASFSGSPSGSVSYQATSYDASDTFSAPASPAPQPPGSFGIAGPGGGATAKTFTTEFDGASGNGDWTLFVYDDNNQSVSISGGWCMNFTQSSGTPTTTRVSGSPNRATTGAAVTVTATVTDANTSAPITSGSVTFTETGVSVAGGPTSPVSVDASGQASFATSSLSEGDHPITATYSGVTGSFSGSIGSYDQRVDNSITTSLTGGVLTYCNTGAIQIPDPNSVGGGAGYPNPSNITVAGLFGTVNTVSVALKNFKDARPDFLTSLLVGPGGNLDFFSGAGGDSSVSTFASLLFEDSAGAQVPGTLGAGPYKPTSDPASGSFPPMVFTSSPFYAVPGTIHSAASNGSSTFASSFGGTAPNGNWDLFFYDHTGTLASAGNGLSGWCLNITPHVPAFTITETHSPSSFIQGSTGQITLDVNNTSMAAVTSGGSAYPVTITDALPNGLTYASISGASNDWSCSGASTVTCTNADVVAGGDSYATLVLNLNVSNTATGGNNPTEVSEGAPGAFGTATGLSSADNIPVIAAPVLSVSEGYSGTFQQGVIGGMLTVIVSNTAGASSSTGDTTTVTETLPAGYTAASFSGTGWSCSGNNSITCTSTQAVAGGASFNVIDITLDVPTTAVNPTFTNAAMASGGGASASATSGTVFFPVVQVPTTMTAGSGTSPQSTAINTAFGTALSVTVKDAAGNAVSGASVTFTAPASGASGSFSNSTNAITVTTNASGVASAGSFTANLTLGGPYTVTASSGSLTAINFSLSNTVGAATHFSVSAPSSATSGTSFSVTVTALDAGNNTATGYSGTVHFTSSDGSAALPSDSTLTLGTGTFSATLRTAGNQTITATDTVSSFVTGTSGQINVIMLPVLSVSEGYSGTFTQGQAGGTLIVGVTNTGFVSSTTSGTTTVTETLPTGYTATSFSGSSGWSCSGTNAVTCLSTQAVGGGGSFSQISILVAVPPNAPNPTTTNAATASGGGASASNTSGTVSFPVVQVPTSMTAGSGTSPQSTPINTAFGTPLSVTVKDAAGNPVSGVSVTFTAPLSGASGTFSNSTNAIAVTTNSSGVASAGSFTANLTLGGPYTVTATSGSLTAVNFSLTNLGVGPVVTTNPLNQTVTAGQTATFTAAATGTPAPTVQWQLSTDGGATFSNLSGASSTTLSFTASAGQNGNQYRAVFTNSLGTATTTAATLTVNFGPSVTTNPSNQTVTAGQAATFTAAASGNPMPTVQWQVSTNGGASFSNLSGATSTTLSFAASAGQNGNQYRAVFTNTGGSATTTAATLAVSPIPTVVSFSVLWDAESYNVIGASRNRLPWQITGIQVVFSAPIVTGNLNSLSGVTTTGFSGLGTNTLTWTISPLALGSFPTTLAGSGANALKDAAGTALAAGAGFTQNLKILYGDFNDDGVVNSQDLVLEAAAIGAPYNIFADMNGDGLVSSADYLVVRSRSGSSLP